MDDLRQIAAKDVVDYLRCGICRGFLIDATALPECDHQFCKSCIVTYCEKPAKEEVLCPVAGCGALIHKTKPLTQLKNDTTMQTLIYKLFPNLYASEMKRRRKYYEDHPRDRQLANGNEQLGIVKKPATHSNHQFLVPKIPPSKPKIRRAPTPYQRKVPPVEADLVTLELMFDHPKGCTKNSSSVSGDKNHSTANSIFLTVPSTAPVRVVREFLRITHRLENRNQIVLTHGVAALQEEMSMEKVIDSLEKGEGGAHLNLRYSVESEKKDSDASMDQ